MKVSRIKPQASQKIVRKSDLPGFLQSVVEVGEKIRRPHRVAENIDVEVSADPKKLFSFNFKF